MSRVFVDTSALVKLYVAEPDSATVQAEISKYQQILISQLGVVEFRSAIWGLVRQRKLTSPAAAHTPQSFQADLPYYDG